MIGPGLHVPIARPHPPRWLSSRDSAEEQGKANLVAAWTYGVLHMACCNIHSAPPALCPHIEWGGRGILAFP